MYYVCFIFVLCIMSYVLGILYSNFDEKLSLFIGSLAAAQSVETIGNSVPVSKAKLLKIISHFLK